MPEQLEFDFGDKESLKVPKLDPCPKCGAKPIIAHPAYDGGALVECLKCHFHPQVETWAPTDREAAIKWNNLCRSLK